MIPALIPAMTLLWLLQSVPDAPPPEPPSFADTLVVTAAGSDQRMVDAVAPTSVLTREDLAGSPGLTLDEQLRQIPGFSLLRRSGSLTAHPTSQGVSLRGLGPSGASRTLVLLDGAPLNDPFGGWVYWNRLPLSALESVEVARGSLSQLYGSAAMGGAIQLLPRAPRPDTFEATARGGDHGTRRSRGLRFRYCFGSGQPVGLHPRRPLLRHGRLLHRLSRGSRSRGPPGRRGLRHPLRPLPVGPLPRGGERLPTRSGGTAPRFRPTTPACARSRPAGPASTGSGTSSARASASAARFPASCPTAPRSS